MNHKFQLNTKIYFNKINDSSRINNNFDYQNCQLLKCKNNKQYRNPLDEYIFIRAHFQSEYSS